MLNIQTFLNFICYKKLDRVDFVLLGGIFGGIYQMWNEDEDPLQDPLIEELKKSVPLNDKNVDSSFLLTLEEIKILELDIIDVDHETIDESPSNNFDTHQNVPSSSKIKKTFKPSPVSISRIINLSGGKLPSRLEAQLEYFYEKLPLLVEKLKKSELFLKLQAKNIKVNQLVFFCYKMIDNLVLRYLRSRNFIINRIPLGKGLNGEPLEGIMIFGGATKIPNLGRNLLRIPIFISTGLLGVIYVGKQLFQYKHQTYDHSFLFAIAGIAHLQNQIKDKIEMSDPDQFYEAARRCFESLGIYKKESNSNITQVGLKLHNRYKNRIKKSRVKYFSELLNELSNEDPDLGRIIEQINQD